MLSAAYKSNDECIKYKLLITNLWDICQFYRFKLMKEKVVSSVNWFKK